MSMATRAIVSESPKTTKIVMTKKSEILSARPFIVVIVLFSPNIPRMPFIDGINPGTKERTISHSAHRCCIGTDQFQINKTICLLFWWQTPHE